MHLLPRRAGHESGSRDRTVLSISAWLLAKPPLPLDLPKSPGGALARSGGRVHLPHRFRAPSQQSLARRPQGRPPLLLADSGLTNVFCHCGGAGPSGGSPETSGHYSGVPGAWGGWNLQAEILPGPARWHEQVLPPAPQSGEHLTRLDPGRVRPTEEASSEGSGYSQGKKNAGVCHPPSQKGH